MGEPINTSGVKATVREDGIFIERPKGYTSADWARMADVMLEALAEGARVLAFKSAMLRALKDGEAKDAPKDDGMVN
jgi:hypothetical protein